MKNKIILYTALAITLLLAGCSTQNTETNAQNTEIIAKANTMSTLGSPNALIKLTEWSDYQCPYCGAWARDVWPQIREKLVDTGTISFQYRDFPISGHSHSITAALGAYCAGDQGKYWEMNEQIFANQKAISLTDMQTYVQKLGLNTDKWNNCVSTKKYMPAIKNNQQIANKGTNGKGKNAISATPTFWINSDWVIVGGQSYFTISDKIDKYIKQMKNNL